MYAFKKLSGTCDANAICTNNVSSYSCTCVDENECVTSKSRCEAGVRYTDGSYTCDECAGSHKCNASGNAALCYNTYVWRPGFEMSAIGFEMR